MTSYNSHRNNNNVCFICYYLFVGHIFHFLIKSKNSYDELQSFVIIIRSVLIILYSDVTMLYKRSNGDNSLLFLLHDSKYVML